MESHILAEKRGALGLLTLNRPQALNALTHDMVRDLTQALMAWAQDDGVRAVAIRGAGRAFCAGGDVRAVRDAVLAGSDAGLALLRDEYRLNALIGTFPKPYVALLHGICMGGGAGVSVHGRYRLADISLVFAMPETAIGFIPDVGASHFLSRLPDRLGLYLGLTGARIGLEDAHDAGLVTHAVAAADFDAVLDRLADGAALKDAAAPVVRKIKPGPLAPHRRAIATLFAATTVEGVLERLDRDGGDFARSTAAQLRTLSPTALKLTFREIHEGAHLSLPQCLAMEYRLASQVIAMPDFAEGVRAALVDKDRAPRWQPAQLAAVRDVDAFFAGGAGGLF